MQGSMNRHLIGCLFIVFWHLIGCGHDPRLGASIEAPFLPYVAEFEKQCGCEVIDIPITFQTLSDEDNAGECWDYFEFFQGFQEIMIDEEWWNKASDVHREQLIFHELGHCRLHRSHLETYDGSFPISLMYPKMGMISSWHYRTNRLKYFDELFQRGDFQPTQFSKPVSEK